MDVEYKHNIASELSETVVMGFGKFSRDMLEPLFVISEKEWKNGEFTVHSFILAASHAVVVTNKSNTFAQVIACGTLKNTDDFDVCFRRDLKRKKHEPLCLSTSYWGVNSNITNFNLTDGIEWFESRNCSFKQERTFPGTGSPFTKVGVSFTKYGLDLYSLHTYPLESSSVGTYLKLLHKSSAL